jgi:diamine N-acetyltransferase
MKGRLVALRAVEPSDIEVLMLWENNPEFWHIGNILTPFSKHLLEQYIQNAHLDIFTTKQYRFVITTCANGDPIGAIDLFDFDPLHQRCGVGILIAHPDNRQKGYATEALQLLKSYAFKTLLVNQLFCNIESSNKSSLRLFTKAGFEITGCKKAWNRTEKGFEDELFLQCFQLDM